MFLTNCAVFVNLCVHTFMWGVTFVDVRLNKQLIRIIQYTMLQHKIFLGGFQKQNNVSNRCLIMSQIVCTPLSSRLLVIQCKFEFTPCPRHWIGHCLMSKQTRRHTQQFYSSVVVPVFICQTQSYYFNVMQRRNSEKDQQEIITYRLSLLLPNVQGIT